VYLNIACLEFAAMSRRLLEYVEDSTSLIRLRLKCDGTRAETTFRLSAKRTSPFKSAVQPTTGSRGVHISGNNVGYTMFRGSVKSTGYPLHSPVFSSLPLPCVTACHHIPTGVYHRRKAVGFYWIQSCRSPYAANIAGRKYISFARKSKAAGDPDFVT
jgi:hypothetical protein